MDGNPCPLLLFHVWLVFVLIRKWPQFLWVHICICSLVSGKLSFFGVIYYLWFIQPFCLLFHELLVEGCDWYIPFMAGHYIFSLHVQPLSISVLNAIYCKKFLGWEMYCNKSSGVALMLCLVRRIVVVCFPQGQQPI